jgi:hypothetical protein
MRITLMAAVLAALGTGCTGSVGDEEAAPDGGVVAPAPDARVLPCGACDGETLLEPPPPSMKVLDVQFQVQETGYWCGPAATRVALSANIDPPSQGALAAQLGTTTNGTDWIGQITAVLNDHLGPGLYGTVEMPNDPPTQAQRARLWDDVLRSIDGGFPIVANIVAPPGNHPPGYPDETIYHYFAVIGYDREGQLVYIADSANFSGQTLYWLSFDQLATLIPPKGYSTYVGP